MPDALRSAAEWAFFQAGLDRADATVLGRLSHEAAPNVKRRRRIVVTRTVAGVEEAADEAAVVRWNPAVPLDRALDAFDRPVASLAVAGGMAVFDLFLAGPHRYTAFHLSRMRGVQLPGGRKVFGGLGPGRTAAAHLHRAGFRPDAAAVLDERASVVTWRPVQ